MTMTDTAAVDAAESAPPLALEALTVPMGQVVTHPGNPRKNLGDLTELVESIRELGVLQPPVVLPAARVAAAWPEHAAALDGAVWVVLMGARRRTAAQIAVDGDDRAPLRVLVRDDLLADDRLGQLDVMTAENVARTPLTPLEEARAFAEQIAAGRSQRDVAARMGCSQPHVSKRVKLLGLPEPMLAKVEDGSVEIGDALVYAGDPDLAADAHKLASRDTWMTAKNALARVREQRDRDAKVAAAKARLDAEGVPVVADPHTTYGSGYWQRQLRDKKEITAARKAGHLGAAIDSHGGVTYLNTVKTLPKKTDPGAAEARAQQRENKRAREARDAACGRLVAAAPTVPAVGVARLLADTVIANSTGDEAKLVLRWLTDAGTWTKPGVQAWEFRRELYDSGDAALRGAAAYALAVAQREMRARGPHRSGWDAQDAAYLRMLIDGAGYTPTAWEHDRLTTAEAGTGGRRGEVAELTYCHDGCCWVLRVDDLTGTPAAWAEHLTEPDQTDDAQQWAHTLLAEEYERTVHAWRTSDGGRWRAVWADQPPAGVNVVDADHDTAAEEEGVGEYRLLFDDVDQAWLLLAGDKPIGDHDGLTAEAGDAACAWASEVLADHGVADIDWTMRLGDAATPLEYVPA